MLQVAQLIICHPKSKLCENFRTVIPGNKRNMILAILLSFFIAYFTSFIYELPSSIQAEAYSELYQRFKMQFLETLVNSSRDVSRMESKIWDETFWEKHFQPSTISVIHYLHKRIHLWSSPEAAIRGNLERKLFLTILQYLQENTCGGVSFW